MSFSQQPGFNDWAVFFGPLNVLKYGDKRFLRSVSIFQTLIQREQTNLKVTRLENMCKCVDNSTIYLTMSQNRVSRSMSCSKMLQM